MSDAPEKKERAPRPATGLKTLPKMTAKPHVDRYEIHNEKFAKEDSAFQAACDKMGIKPTTRQASKWRNKKGKAYLEGR